MFQLIEQQDGLSIGVFGIGGCGCNTLNSIYEQRESKQAKLFSVNTDKVVLEHTQSDDAVLIGAELTHGYGAGADPEVGLQAAQESKDQLLTLINSCDILLCATGLGGGTGTGASPYIAELAREQNKPVIFVATLPFSSEGQFRSHVAQTGLNALKEHANAVITLPNDQLIQVLGDDVDLFDAFKHSNQILHSLIKSLIDMLCYQGLINVDLNDFAKIMDCKGDAVLGVGKCDLEDEFPNALDDALNNPLVNQVDMSSSSGVIVQVNCKDEISLGSYNLITDTVRQQVSPNALVICGVSKIESLATNYELLIIATGASAKMIVEPFNNAPSSEVEQSPAARVKPQASDIFDIPAFIRNQAPAPSGK
ncbi:MULTISPECIES: cell division protein FtsZ [Pseudoalteromonas]|uniref:Cell division protein FtsZ n=1 Tax=Pseudoalteromonas porphyrae TaxID=187330 RepID=A0A0N0M1P2_9GAMM|nr:MULTISPECIES: cell division protein FtsZ [Pseudoalteromonas]KPH65448.1 cell division protein FtsZ [Pseudoalteromonas porphyrae]